MNSGREGEAAAERHLGAQGFRILERRWRGRRGEVDLIALDGEVLVFVEVKSRSSDRFGTAAEAVGPRKQRRLSGAAAEYLALSGRPDQAVRFDVVAIDGGAVSHIRDAFPARA